MSAALKSRYNSLSAAGRKAIEHRTDAERAQIVEADNATLADLGYKPEFKRDFRFLGLFSLVQSALAVLPGVAGSIW